MTPSGGRRRTCWTVGQAGKGIGKARRMGGLLYSSIVLGQIGSTCIVDWVKYMLCDNLRYTINLCEFQALCLPSPGL